MKAAFGGAALALASLALSQVVPRKTCDLPPVTSEGNAFWANGERFYIRGVAYQPGGSSKAADPMLDKDSFKRDVEEFKKLGINVIRIYTVDNKKNHDEAMALLCDAGIYLALDANTPEYSLNRVNPTSLHASYNDVYLQSVFATIDAFAGYSNLLLFFCGNEVINDDTNTYTAPYIKAVNRDMKLYVAAQADRPIPIGYSSADIAQNIESQALYFACGEDEMARSDFFAFNDYSWCSPSSYEQSGWKAKTATYHDYALPLFLSEFGCITGIRDWSEIAALYSSQMSVAYSGGLAYEYSLEENGYGLVQVSHGDVVPNKDFQSLMKAYSATPNPSGNAGARKTRSVPKCPPFSSKWRVKTNALPEMPEGAKKYLKKGAGKGPGLEGDGSQWAGTPTPTKTDLSDGTTTGSSTEFSYGSRTSSSPTHSKTGAAAASARPVSLLTMIILTAAMAMGM